MFARLYNLVTMLVAVSLVSVLLVEPIAALPKSPMVTAPHKVTTKTTKTPPAAQPPVATKPENATGPFAGWLVIAPQKTHWYKFNYHYNNKDKNSQPTQVTVKLTAKAKGCLIFEVWTAGGLQSGNGQKHKPIGVGSPMKGLGRVLLWVGGSAASETYYIAVKNKTDNKTCPYQLSISGPDVAY